MLGNGELTVLWFIRTPERDKRYIPIPVYRSVVFPGV